jgi:hypothetical protein
MKEFKDDRVVIKVLSIIKVAWHVHVSRIVRVAGLYPKYMVILLYGEGAL